MSLPANSQCLECGYAFHVSPRNQRNNERLCVACGSAHVLYDHESPDSPNPVIARAPLASHPLWTVRIYRDGMYDAVNGIAVTPGFESIEDLDAYVCRVEDTSGPTF